MLPVDMDISSSEEYRQDISRLVADQMISVARQWRDYRDPLASVNVLAFDGSARRVATADANPGWSPANFTDMARSAQLRFQWLSICVCEKSAWNCSTKSKLHRCKWAQIDNPCKAGGCT